MDQWENQFYEHLSGRLGWASHKRSGIIGLRTQIQAELNIFLSRAPGSSRIKPDQSLSLSVLQVPEEEKLNKCLYPYKIYIYICTFSRLVSPILSVAPFKSGGLFWSSPAWSIERACVSFQLFFSPTMKKTKENGPQSMEPESMSLKRPLRTCSSRPVGWSPHGGPGEPKQSCGWNGPLFGGGSLDKSRRRSTSPKNCTCHLLLFSFLHLPRQKGQAPDGSWGSIRSPPVPTDRPTATADCHWDARTTRRRGRRASEALSSPLSGTWTGCVRLGRPGARPFGKKAPAPAFLSPRQLDVLPHV